MPIPIGASRAERARRRLASTAVAACLCLPAAVQAQPLRLGDVLSRAAAHDLGRPVSSARLDAAEAAVRQAGVRPNPSLELEIENFGGTGDRELTERTETTLAYQQTLERGGKREARVGAARAEVLVARSRAEVRALDLLAAVQTLWVEAAAADVAVEVAAERLAVAQRLERETARRVRAARDPLFTGERARTAVAQARIALDQARDAAANARAALAAYVGEPVEIDRRDFTDLQAQAGVADETARTPDLALLEAERDAATSRVRLEQARAVQDPTVRAGVRHFREGGDVAFVVGGSIPLGRHDRNRGAVERARAERLAAEAEIAAARVERDREIARLAARRAAATAEVRRLEAEVLPSAQKAAALVRDGYNRGGGAFTYLEVAEAERTLIDVKARRLDLLKSFQLDGVRLDRLTGRHVALLAQAELR